MAGSGPPEMLAGAARVDITPPLNVPYLGYYDQRHAFFRGVHDLLFAKAVMVGEGEGRIALISADAIGFSRRIMGPGRDFVAEVRARAHRLCGILPDRIMLAATHAHSTPETIGFRPLLQHPGMAEWLEVLADKLAWAVALADGAREPARVKVGTGTVEGVSWSRRIVGRDGRLYSFARRPPDQDIAAWGANDPEVAVICLEDLSGRPKTVLMHFACHPVTVQVNPLVSADFPGAATKWVEGADVGCQHCLYLQGAGASINPVHDTSGFEDVMRYGRILGSEVVKVLGQMAAPDYPTAGDAVGCATATIELASREVPDLAELKSEWELRRREAENLGSEQQRAQARQRALVLEEHIARAELGDGPFLAELQAFRIGNVLLAGVPVEPFVELGLSLKQAGALCVGYANDYLGYVAPPEAWEQGGYEVSLGMWSILNQEAFGKILETSRWLLGQLA